MSDKAEATAALRSAGEAWRRCADAVDAGELERACRFSEEAQKQQLRATVFLARYLLEGVVLA